MAEAAQWRDYCEERQDRSGIDHWLRLYHFLDVKKPSIIITDPRKMAEILSRRPTVSKKEAVQSILAQNGKGASSPAVKTR